MNAHENNNINSDISSEDTDYSEDEQDNAASLNVTNHNIEKRSYKWCGVDSEQLLQEYNKPRRVEWPPQGHSSKLAPSTYSQVNLRHVRMGNPVLGTKMQLYSKTGHHLAIYPDGTVKGTPDENDLHTYLELVSAGYPSHVKIKGLLTNAYVAMDQIGRLYAEFNPADEGTVFIESFQRSYNTYLSRKYAHLGWYLGLKKSGKFKKGPKTDIRQKAVKFLPRRTKFE